MKTSRSILLLILISLHPTAYADCPDCYRDQQPLDPARGYSADGRVKIVVGIAVGNSADSWANPPGTSTPDPRLAAAAGQGMTMWNNATDSQGQKTNYYFDTVSGTQPVNNVDIVIVKRPFLNEEGQPNVEGEMETGGGRPFKLFIREDVIGRINDTNLAGFVAHELGHRIGLADTRCAGTLMQSLQPPQTARRVVSHDAGHRLGAGRITVEGELYRRFKKNLR